jgi:hypothetical protein
MNTALMAAVISARAATLYCETAAMVAGNRILPGAEPNSSEDILGLIAKHGLDSDSIKAVVDMARLDALEEKRKRRIPLDDATIEVIDRYLKKYGKSGGSYRLGSNPGTVNSWLSGKPQTETSIARAHSAATIARKELGAQP